ncbi:MAG: tetratricopeptide repeat protein [Polyangiales bacterium]
MSGARVWLMAGVLFVGAYSLGSRARAEGENPPGYDAAIDEALAAFDHGRFADARELFLRAHKISPNARTLRALGKTEYELKRYDEAASHLALALDSDVRPLTEQQRGETTVLLRKSEDFLATYTLRLDPPHAELRLDGTPVGLDARAALRLIAGEHVLEATAPEYEPWRRELSVRARVDTVLSVQLSPLASAPAVTLAPTERQDAPPRKRRWILWTSLGVLVAAGAITGVVLALGRDEPARASGGNSGLVWPLGGAR